MQTTKAQILALLKRRGRLPVDSLSEELGLAPMTVRQHLTSLERDRLIDAAPERQPKGRPRYVYSLTDRGEDTFPKRYDWLAAELLAEVGRMDPLDLTGLTPAERTEFILDQIADRMVAQHSARLRGLSLDARVREVAALLQRESGFVEWAKTADGYEICDYNCKYRALTDETSDACSWHRRVIGRLVGPPATFYSAAERGGACCRYVVLARVHSEAMTSTPSFLPLDGVEQMISQEVH